MPARAASRRFRHSLGGLCLLALLLLPLLHLWPALSGLNNAHLDWLIRQRAAEQTPDPRLLLIDIDDLSLQVLATEAGKWPWPRSLHAELLEYLLNQQPKVVAFDPGQTLRLGGVDVPEAEQKRILESLGFTVGEGWQVTCPLRRHDIEGSADLVEEVVRIHGLDKVASVALPRAEGVARPTATPQQKLERGLRRAAGRRRRRAQEQGMVREAAAARLYPDAL